MIGPATMRIALFVLLCCSVLRGDTLSDLKAQLHRLNGRDLVKASVAFEFSNRHGTAKKPVVEEGQATLLVEDGPEGLRLFWSREQIETADRELRDQTQDPDKTTPTRRAMELLSTTVLSDYFDGAGGLLRTLAQAQLVEEKSATWQGHPARLLVFKLTPRISEQDRKYIKELEATAKVWIGVEGIPLAAESWVRTKGRVILVIGFEFSEKEEFGFTRSGNRLIVTRHIKESSGSGSGERGQQKTVADLTLTGS
jgi:hypothetical protein